VVKQDTKPFSAAAELYHTLHPSESDTSAAQYSTTQHNTAQHSTTQHNMYIAIAACSSIPPELLNFTQKLLPSYDTYVMPWWNVVCSCDCCCDWAWPAPDVLCAAADCTLTLPALLQLLLALQQETTPASGDSTIHATEVLIQTNAHIGCFVMTCTVL
jgi:hypothetical protein